MADNPILPISIILFWLGFGFAVMFLAPQLNPNLNIPSVDAQPSNILDVAVIFFKYIGFFFQCMTLTITGVPIWLSIFTSSLLVISIIYILLFIKTLIPTVNG